MLDEFAVYSGTLTEAEIGQLSAGTATPSDIATAPADADNDGLTNLQEYSSGSDPTNPFSPAVPNAVRAAATADFNGDGMADLLVRNKETKAWWLYTLNGNAVGTSTSLNASDDSTWHPVATEDFEGDGNADLLIRSEQGSW